MSNYIFGRESATIIMPTHLCLHMLLTSFIPEVKILEGFKMRSPKASLNKNISLSMSDFVSGDNWKVTFAATELQN